MLITDEEKARRFVEGLVGKHGSALNKEAAMEILRKRCKGRGDDMSVAIKRELDRLETGQAGQAGL